jgi:Protein of unknown function (DUF3551)
LALWRQRTQLLINVPIESSAQQVMAINPFTFPVGQSGLKPKTEREEKMKQLLTTVAASTAVIFTLAITAMPAAQAGSEYALSSPGGTMAWGFNTLEQCQASASGPDGTCYIDPFVAAPANAYAYSPRSVRHLANAYAYSPRSVRHLRK